MPHSPKEELIGLYARPRGLKLGLSVVLALLFIQVGRSWPFWEGTSFRDLSFDVIFAVLITYGAFSLVEYIQVWLDLRCGWSDKVIRRITLQLGLGVCLPLAFVLLCYVGYGKLYYQQHFDLSKSLFFKVDLPVAFLMLLLVNAYYAFRYFIHQLQNVPPANVPAPTAAPAPADGAPSVPAAVAEEKPAEATAPVNVLLVSKGQKQHIVPVGQIAYLAIAGELVTVRLFDESAYWLNESLETVEKTLPASFFRANRQCIVSFKAVQSFVTEKSGRLILDVVPEPEAPVVVSQRRASEFKSWLLMH